MDKADSDLLKTATDPDTLIGKIIDTHTSGFPIGLTHTRKMIEERCIPSSQAPVEMRSLKV